MLIVDLRSIMVDDENLYVWNKLAAEQILEYADNNPFLPALVLPL